MYTCGIEEIKKVNVVSKQKREDTVMYENKRKIIPACIYVSKPDLFHVF